MLTLSYNIIIWITGAAEATFNRSGQSSSSILQKGLRESIRIQQCFVDFRARFRVIAHKTSKCVVDETQYKAISYVWLSLVASYWHLVCLKIIETHCKSGPAKTRPARLVPPPLDNVWAVTSYKDTVLSGPLQWVQNALSRRQIYVDILKYSEVESSPFIQ